jgi:hypothetical protein
VCSAGGAGVDINRDATIEEPVSAFNDGAAAYLRTPSTRVPHAGGGQR